MRAKAGRGRAPLRVSAISVCRPRQRSADHQGARVSRVSIIRAETSSCRRQWTRLGVPYRWRPTVGGRRCLAMIATTFRRQGEAVAGREPTGSAMITGARHAVVRRTCPLGVSRHPADTVGAMRIGLTGGIGSGKSTAAARFAELGALVVDSDQLAREVVEPGTPGLAAVVEAFGPGILDADGRLDRPALGAVVFADERARGRLNGILHPLIRARVQEIVAAAPAGTVIVQDVPLLVESGQAGSYDLVVVVETAEELRLERLARDRGMTAGEARARMASQATDADRRAAADVVLTNDTTPADLRAQVDHLWNTRVAPPA